MRKKMKWVGLGLLSLLTIMFISDRVLTQAAPDGISTLASDWGVTVSDDKKSIIWSSDLISARWIDPATIEISSTKNPAFKLFAKPNNEIGGKTTLFDQRGRNYDQKNYDLEGWHKNPCWGTAYWDNPEEPWKTVTQVKLDMDFGYDTINDCVSGKGDNNVLTINVSNPENSIAYFKWLDPAQLQTFDNNGSTKSGNGNGVFKQSSEYPSVYLSVDDDKNAGSCQDRVVVNDDLVTLTYYDLNNDGGGDTPESAHTTCNFNSYDETIDWYPSGKTLNILNKSAYDNNPPGTVIPDGVDPDSNDGDVPACEGAIDNGFGWIICPILDGADKIINATERIIKSKLEINSEFTEEQGLRDAWTQLARISSGLLVIVALVMIVSTALGLEVVSSYTVKKMLPRIVIGAIGIWLSWALATTYINFMNDLGRGITNVMFSPFKDSLAGGNTFANVDLKYIVQKSFASTDSTTDLAALGVFSVPIISMVVGSGGPFGILAAAVPAIGAMLIGLFLLTLRQILIVFLLVLAPIGVAAWMLPNTQKGWKLWSGTFNKLLLMYPLFMGAFAAGKIFALIAADATKTDNGVLEVIVPMLGYISPFFFIPVLFKLAGSIFGNITGMVNNKGKGAFDKIRGGLEAKSKARQTFKDQMGNEKLARNAAGKGAWSSLSRARMRARGGQPITGGMLTVRNRDATRNRIRSSMDAAQDKLEAQQVEEETVRMSREGVLGDRNALRARAVTGSIVQRRAAINQLMNIGDDDGMRFVQGVSANHADRAVTDMWSKVRSSENYAKAFKDKAPDLTAPKPEVAFGDIKPSAIPGLSGSTIDKIFQTHAKNITSSDPDVVKAANQSMDRFLSSVQSAMNDEFLRNQLSANNMMALSGNIVAGGLGSTTLPTGGTVRSEILARIDADVTSVGPTPLKIIEALPGSTVGPQGVAPYTISTPRPAKGSGKIV